MSWRTHKRIQNLMADREAYRADQKMWVRKISSLSTSRERANVIEIRKKALRKNHALTRKRIESLNKRIEKLEPRVDKEVIAKQEALTNELAQLNLRIKQITERSGIKVSFGKSLITRFRNWRRLNEAKLSRALKGRVRRLKQTNSILAQATAEQREEIQYLERQVLRAKEDEAETQRIAAEKEMRFERDITAERRIIATLQGKISRTDGLVNEKGREISSLTRELGELRGQNKALAENSQARITELENMRIETEKEIQVLKEKEMMQNEELSKKSQDLKNMRQIREKNSELQQQITAAEKKYAELSSEHRKSQIELEKKQGEIVSFGKQLGELRDQNKALAETTKAKIAELENTRTETEKEIQRLKGNESELKRELSKKTSELQNLEKMREENSRLQQQAKTAEENYTRLLSEYKQGQTQLTRLEKENTNLGKQLEKQAQENERVLEESQRARVQIKELEAETISLNSEIEQQKVMHQNAIKTLQAGYSTEKQRAVTVVERELEKTRDNLRIVKRRLVEHRITELSKTINDPVLHRTQFELVNSISTRFGTREISEENYEIGLKSVFDTLKSVVDQKITSEEANHSLQQLHEQIRRTNKQ